MKERLHEREVKEEKEPPRLWGNRSNCRKGWAKVNAAERLLRSILGTVRQPFQRLVDWSDDHWLIDWNDDLGLSNYKKSTKAWLSKVNCCLCIFRIFLIINFCVFIWHMQNLSAQANVGYDALTITLESWDFRESDKCHSPLVSSGLRYHMLFK